MLTIRDVERTYYISLHSVPEPPQELAERAQFGNQSQPVQFLRWWDKMAAFFDCPYQAQVEPGALTIVRAKLRRYTMDELKERARVFWLRHADPLRGDDERGPVPHQIRFFASRLAEIEHEMEVERDPKR